MDHNLSRHVDVKRVLNGVVAGTTDQTTAAIDLEDYDGVLFVALAGAVSANAVSSIKVQQSSDDAAADAYDDIAGSTSSVALTPSTDDNKVILLDIYRPGKRYLKLVWHRATGNTVIDGVLAIRYHGKLMPSTLDATIKALTVLNAPAEGTA